MTVSNVRDVDAFLADMDALLAEVPDTAGTVSTDPAAPVPDVEPAPVPDVEPAPLPDVEPAPVPDIEPDGDSWEEVTAASRRPEPMPGRVKHISARGWRPYGPTSDLDVTQPPDGEINSEPEPVPPPLAAAPRPTAPPAHSLTKATSETDEEATGQDGDTPAGQEEAGPPPTRVQLVATTVRQWHPPTGPKGRGWIRAVVYTGSAMLTGWTTGFTPGAYQTLRDLSVNPDAVAGIAIAAALAALMISRSRRTWIALGCALVLVLILSYLTLSVCTGALATLLVWGLDQLARHMRPVIAWTVRAAFSGVALATFALVWTTVVHVLTGAS